MLKTKDKLFFKQRISDGTGRKVELKELLKVKAKAELDSFCSLNAKTVSKDAYNGQ